MKNKLMTTKENKELYTTKELSAQLKCGSKTIFNCAKKCLPNKKIENGKTTYWTQAEITILIEEMKKSNSNQYNLVSSLQGVSTELTPALKAAQFAKSLESADVKQLSLLSMAFISELQKRCDTLQDTCDSQAKALEYSKAIGKRKWSEVKKEYHLRFTVDYIKKHFEKDSGWFSAVMGDDKFPTFWVSENVVNTLLETE